MTKIPRTNAVRWRICHKIDFSKTTIVTWVLFFFILLMGADVMASDKEYEIERKPDGGYTIDLRINKRHWKPITVEGFFPKQELYFKIELSGEGNDWSSKDQFGYYYSSDLVSSKGKAWDFGYAWVDRERKFLYLNFFWASSPDKMIASDANGKYRLPQGK